MRRSLSSLLGFLLLPLISSCQEKPERIHTQSTFATLGDYNPLNGYILFSAPEVDTLSKELTGTSVRIKNMSTEAEAVIQKNTLLPAIGWLDSSRVLLEAGVATDDKFLFGGWRRFLIRHNIFTHQQDTLPSSWYTSSNNADNFLTSSNKLFYKIAYGSEEMKTTHWIAYSLEAHDSKIIKKFNNDHSFSIITYQYLPDTDEIIYIKGKGSKKEFIRLSLATGAEKIIKTILTRNVEESSAVIKSKFYFIVRELPKDSSNHPDTKKVRYLLKSLDLKTGIIADVYTSKSEITKISPYKEGMMLLSVQGNTGESNAHKSFDLKAGGEVTVGLDATSYLYALKLD